MRAALRPVALGLVAALLAYAFYRSFYPDDESQVRAILARAASAFSATDESDRAGRLVRIAALATDLAADVAFDRGEHTERVVGRDNVVAAALAMAGAIPDLKLELTDIEVGFDEQHREALVHLTAEAHFRDAGESGLDAREVDVLFRRTDGRWLVTTVLPVETLR